MRYTQGEWVIKPDNSIMSSTNKAAVICQLGSADNNDIEKAANAKLIANNMLQTLQDILNCENRLDYHSDRKLIEYIKEIAREAINKATL